MGDEQRSGEESLSQIPRVTMYTDGAAEPNPGKGGYGVVLLHPAKYLELSMGFELTTNNRMELLGVIAGLEALKKPCSVTIYSDSKYVVEAIDKGWILRWQKKNGFRTKFEQAKNWDLWERYLLAAARHEVKLEWIKGHAGHEHNERCDVLAVAAAKGTDLQIDHGFRPNVTPSNSDTLRSAPSDNGVQSTKSPSVPDNSPKRSKLSHKEPGELCRKCGTAIEKRVPKKQTRKATQAYYYEWYLYCPGCVTMYMVEEAKVFLSTSQRSIFDGSKDEVDHV